MDMHELQAISSSQVTTILHPPWKPRKLFTRGGAHDQPYPKGSGCNVYAVRLGDDILVSSPSPTLSRLNLGLFSTSAHKWRDGYDACGELPQRQGHSIAPLSDKAVFFGGEVIDDCHGNSGPSQDTYLVTLNESILSCDPLLLSSDGKQPQARAWHSATTVKLDTDSNRKGIIILGGKGASNNALTDIWKLELEEATEEEATDSSSESNTTPRAVWTELMPSGTCPLPLAGHQAIAVNNTSSILVLGGMHPDTKLLNNAVFILDLQKNAWSELPVSIPHEVNTSLARVSFTALNVRLSPENVHEENEQSEFEQVLIFGGHSQEEDADVNKVSTTILLNPADGSICSFVIPELESGATNSFTYIVSSDGTSIYRFTSYAIEDDIGHTSVLEFNLRNVMKSDLGDENVDPNALELVDSRQMKQGGIYTGEIRTSTGLRHGQGKCTYSNGDEYEGSWEDDKRNGHGCMKYSNGEMYTGDWVDDKRSGQGTMKYPPPRTVISHETVTCRYEVEYDGEWDKGLRSGKGMLTYSDGSTLSAAFQDGHMERIVHLSNFDCKGDEQGWEYEGEASHGLPHGRGTCSRNGEVYTGEWKDGLRHGEGQEKLRDGSVYVGSWRNGKRNGFGSCEYKLTKEKYQGKWVGGMRCGRGTAIFANGSTYTGQWKRDLKHGLGKMVQPDGSTLEGTWKRGIFYPQEDEATTSSTTAS